MNRVVVQEGYKIPFAGFDGYRRRKHHKRRHHKRGHYGSHGGRSRMARKMKECAKRWRRSGHGSYRAFMKRCLKSR